MLDDYSLRLLAEIGIDVYVPRTASASGHDEPTSVANSFAAGASTATAFPHGSAESAGILILCGPSDDGRLRQDLLRALRMARLDAAIADAATPAAIAGARGLVVLGEALARRIGADLPAQRQNEIVWVVARELPALSQDAGAKRALWGEFKRLSRSLATARQP